MTPNILLYKIKPIVLIISSQENFELKYLRTKFYCLEVKFQVATWKPVNSFLTPTVDKTNHMPVIAPFSV